MKIEQQELEETRVPASSRRSGTRQVATARSARSADHREINRDEHDDLLKSHAQHMATHAAQKQYAARGGPFAQIKHQFSASRLLLRGLNKVRIERNWLVSAFHLRPLLPLIHPRPEPTFRPHYPKTSLTTPLT